MRVTGWLVAGLWLAALGVIYGLIHEVHGASDLFLGESRDGDEDFVDSLAIFGFGGTDFHRRRARAAMIRAPERVVVN